MTTAQKIASIQKWITFLTDAKWKRRAIQFNLANKEVSELMEDLFDSFMATERMDEPHSDFEQVKKRLLRKKQVV